jgi:hypothetical protein
MDGIALGQPVEGGATWALARSVPSGVSAAPLGPVEVVAADEKLGVSVDRFEQDLLTTHADFGWIASRVSFNVRSSLI